MRLLSHLFRMFAVPSAILVGGACAAWFTMTTLAFDETSVRTSNEMAKLRESRMSFHSHPRSIKVAILTTPESISAVESLQEILKQTPLLHVESIDSNAIHQGHLTEHQVLLVPGGSGHQKAEHLEGRGRDAIRAFVRAGGGYVGICGGAFLASSGYDWSLGLMDVTTLTGMIDCGDGQRHAHAARGSGSVDIQYSFEAKMIFDEDRDFESVAYSSGPIFRIGNRRDLPPIIVLACFRTELYECPAQRGTMINTPAIITSAYGSGRVMLFSPHPEMSHSLQPLLIDAIACSAESVAPGR